MNEPKPLKTSAGYLKTLEEAKKQNQRYVEVSKLYELPTSRKEEQIEYAPPDFDHPLTTIHLA